MKKIINGKKYDTETAKELGSNWYGRTGDLDCWRETLYQKRTGEFFLMGTGGAASKYAEPCGNGNWSGSSQIIPLDLDAAQKWAEENLSGDEYESAFGVVDDDDKQALTLSLLGNVVSKIRRRSSVEGISMSDYVADLVEKDNP